MKPTLDMYGFVQAAYDHFNADLFGGRLPQALLTFQREKSVFGYFSAKRWQDGDGRLTHEISLNPMYFITHKPLELFQTLVHEMCHLWQYEFGDPGWKGYHNKEWADKMESIGLMPSDTGVAGGKRTGSRMSDYPLPGGEFYRSCLAFAASGNHLPFVDIRYPAPKQGAQVRDISAEHLALLQNHQLTEGDEGGEDRPGQELAQQAGIALIKPFAEQFALPHNEADYQMQQQMAAKKAKVCYQCGSCGIKLWGKPNLHVICGECSQDLEALEH